MSKKTKKGNWGGYRVGAGRKPKNYIPPQPPEATNTPPEPPEATNTPPEPPKGTNTPPEPPEATNTPPEPPEATNTPPEPPKGTNTPPEPPSSEDDEIDFSKYRRSEATGTPPLEDPIQKQTAPPPAPVVVINGMILLQIVNFLAPPLFKMVMNFGTSGYLSEDFELDESERKILEPAADSVARRLFANMPDYVQLLLGYGMISFSNARKKKKLREIAEKRKTGEPTILKMEA